MEQRGKTKPNAPPPKKHSIQPIKDRSIKERLRKLKNTYDEGLIKVGAYKKKKMS
jgi:hypothetical protein